MLQGVQVPDLDDARGRASLVDYKDTSCKRRAILGVDVGRGPHVGPDVVLLLNANPPRPVGLRVHRHAAAGDGHQTAVRC